MNGFELAGRPIKVTEKASDNAPNFGNGSLEFEELER
jgi:hypothetical protein